MGNEGGKRDILIMVVGGREARREADPNDLLNGGMVGSLTSQDGVDTTTPLLWSRGNRRLPSKRAEHSRHWFRKVGEGRW